MENVRSFTFFDGYFEAIKDLSDKDKKDILLAITEYVFEEKEPDFKGVKKSLWALIKPSLDISKVRSKAKQNKIKLKSNENQIKIKSKSNPKENEIKIKSNQNLCSLLEKEKEIEVEIEDINSSCSSNNNYSVEREKQEQQLQQLFINCTGSTNLQAISECISYLDDFPIEVINIALKKTSEKNGRLEIC